jgi:FkbM family methyltransferase
MPEFDSAVDKVKSLSHNYIMVGLYNKYGKWMQRKVRPKFITECFELDQLKIPFELSFTNKEALNYFKEFLQNDSYKSINILNKNTIFFIPNNITEWRIKSFFTKEPETLDWIDGFNKKKIIFWDIGANIGLYSIYAALKHNDIEIVSFEPSTSNLRVLSRNISINNLENKIKIFTNPLSNKNNKFLIMKETEFIEGGALNCFGENFNFEGKKISSTMNYKILGNTINNLLKSKILRIPNYIKLDVDGIEHLILEGGDKYLKNKNIKGLCIEINENFIENQALVDFLRSNDINVFLNADRTVEQDISLSSSTDFALQYLVF